MPLLEIAQDDAVCKSVFWVKRASCFLASRLVGKGSGFQVIWQTFGLQEFLLATCKLAPEQTQPEEHRDTRGWVPLLRAPGECCLPNRKLHY